MAVKQDTSAAADDKFIINIALGNDNEPRDVFVGAGGCDYLIKRGHDVTVPRVVLEVLDHAISGVPERDSFDQNKTVFVERKRFPYTVVGKA